MKKLFGVIAIAAIAAAGWNFSQSQNEVELSDLALANVEALADNESDSKGTLYSTEPDKNGHTTNCCCPGDKTCGASACAKC